MGFRLVRDEASENITKIPLWWNISCNTRVRTFPVRGCHGSCWGAAGCSAVQRHRVKKGKQKRRGKGKNRLWWEYSRQAVRVPTCWLLLLLWPVTSDLQWRWYYYDVVICDLWCEGCEGLTSVRFGYLPLKHHSTHLRHFDILFTRSSISPPPATTRTHQQTSHWGDPIQQLH